MKWYNAYSYMPKDMTYIWLWNTISQKQELMIAKWLDGQWEADKLPVHYARIWAYVFDEDEAIKV